MIFPVYRCPSDGLSFNRTGEWVADVEAPDGSSLEVVSGLFRPGGGRIDTVLMVPDQHDSFIRYAFDVGDICLETGVCGWDVLSG